MGVNYNDYLAAVERLRLLDLPDNDDKCKLIYGSTCYLPTNPAVRADKVLIYDAERDQTPASVEWLREVLGPEPDVDEVWLVNGRYVAWYGESMALFLGDIKLTTRGDVLTALRLFAKKEGA